MMKLASTLLATAALATTALFAAGEAQALDCAAAATDPVGKGICASPALLARENEMEMLFAEALKLSTDAERPMLERVQKSWIEERSDNCSDLDAESLIECLGEGLDERIAELKATPETGPGSPSRMIPIYVVRDGDARHYSVYAQGFRFADPRSEGEKLFNAHVADIMSKLPNEVPSVDDDVEEGEDEAAATESVDAEEEAEVLESDTSMAMKFASPKLLSAAAFWWYDNADDGVGGLQTININMETGKDIVIADLVSESSAAEMRKQCRERIIEQKKEQIDEFYKPEEDAMLKDEVIGEHVATLSRWMITAEEVSILFDTGVIGEPEEGDYECVFSMADLKKLALPTAPLP